MDKNKMKKLTDEQLKKVSGGMTINGELKSELKPPEYEKGTLTIPIDPMVKANDSDKDTSL